MINYSDHLPPFNVFFDIRSMENLVIHEVLDIL
jgi:hypothetical protein